MAIYGTEFSKSFPLKAEETVVDNAAFRLSITSLVDSGSLSVILYHQKSAALPLHSPGCSTIFGRDRKFRPLVVNMFALPLPPVVSVLQPCSLELTPIWHSRLILYPDLYSSYIIPRPFVASLRLTASSRLLAPPSDSPKCLRFGHWLTLCTLDLLTYYHKV